jgi:MCM AAA-lid domain
MVKESFQPVMTDAAAVLLEKHYEMCRSAQSNTIPVTVRFLESLIRLSQAHARLMFRNEVTLVDAVAVIQIMESSAFAYGGFDGGESNVDSLYRDPMTLDFSAEADLDFLCMEYRILQRYQMLDYMDDELCRKARSMLNDGDNLQNKENTWDLPSGTGYPHSQAVAQDHYQRLHFTSQS